MYAKDLIRVLEQMDSYASVTVLINGTAFLVKDTIPYLSKSGMRLALVPNTQHSGSQPNLKKVKENGRG